MKQRHTHIVVYLALALVFAGCAGQQLVMAPDTAPGAQIKPAYVVGDWCTNRDLTSEANKDAGNSALSNLSQQFWRFREDGIWQNSESGWLYRDFGKWQLQGLNTIVLSGSKGEPVSYQANFGNAGKDLHLKDGDDKFLVLSRCD